MEGKLRLETLRLLRCPRCKRGKLQGGQAGESVILKSFLHCDVCNQTFPVEDGIPVFLPDNLLKNSSDPSFSSLDEGTRQKVLQRQWHDQAHMSHSDAYKRSTYGERSLFAFRLYYQLREVEAILAARQYSTIANVCCGQGFELEYLSLFGRHVIAADISLKSVQRAVAKGEKLGISVEGICCDAENLPLQDNACELTITHHSLHHLANPIAGLEEMVRVSSGTIALFEPAKGIARYLARALGLKPTVEESGNKVYEFSSKELRQLCQKSGARLRYLRRSLVTGPTSEPQAFKRLDEIGLTRTLCSGIAIANRFAGRLIGTKCSVVMDKAWNPTLALSANQ
jgi:ubiquinone/menaquinone biosynthesis C-methylase UbiE/uncharacterized protein YbaR (Trm112 family)